MSQFKKGTKIPDDGKVTPEKMLTDIANSMGVSKEDALKKLLEFGKELDRIDDKNKTL